MPVFLKRNPLLDVTAVSNVFLLEYMPKAPEGFTKAYLLGLMQTGAPGAEAAGLDVSGVLGVSETEPPGGRFLRACRRGCAAQICFACSRFAGCGRHACVFRP